ncbi:MAG: major capsid protein [Rhodospirillales bacterium]|nr:major capsid protein [Rhodospirillales bacterium]
MVDIFQTAFLHRVVEALDQPSSFLLDTFFPKDQKSQTAEIYFDVLDNKPRLTPFVHPSRPAPVVSNHGYFAKSFRPAYVKDKRIFNPDAPLRRSVGEQIGGSMSPMQRREAQVAEALVDQLEMLTRREEAMAAEALLTGKVTVKGDGYPETVVDFQRDPALTVTLGSGAQWGDSGVKPLDDLENFAATIQDKSGSVAKTVVMSPATWKIFRQDQDVKTLLDRRAYMNIEGLNVEPIVRGQGNEKARNVGTIGDFDIWVYQDFYIDDADVKQKLIPDNTLIIAARGAPGTGKGGLEGVRGYGVILDEKSGYKSDRYFVKSWPEEDPPVRMMLLQSAPLTVPYRPNASMRVTVKT